MFKVLNDNTLLFPTIHLAIADEYINENGTYCIVTIVSMNTYMLLGKLGRKRYSAEVRRTWDGFDCLCGKPKQLYEPLFVNTYKIAGQQFEFVKGSDILWNLV